MAEATNITFTPISVIGGFRSALITATADATNTITLSNHSQKVTTIKAVFAHVKSTGVPVTYSYATNVLTRTTAGTGVEDVIVIYF